jgi:hypothetical protein
MAESDSQTASVPAARFLEAVLSPNVITAPDEHAARAPVNIFDGDAGGTNDTNGFEDDVRCGFDALSSCNAASGGASKEDSQPVHAMCPTHVQAPSFVQTTPKPMVMPDVHFTIPPPHQRYCAVRIGGPQCPQALCPAVGFTCAGCFPDCAAAVEFYERNKRAGDECFGPLQLFPLDKPFLIGNDLPVGDEQRSARIREILRKTADATRKKTDSLMDDIKHERTWEEQEVVEKPSEEEFNCAFREKWTAVQSTMEKLSEQHQQAQQQRGQKQRGRKQRGRKQRGQKQRGQKQTQALGWKQPHMDWPQHLVVPDQHFVVFALAFDPDDDGPLKEQYVVTVFGAESSKHRANAFISDRVQRDRKNFGPIYSHPTFKPILPDITNLDGFEKSVTMICETMEQQDIMDALDPNSDLRKAETRQVEEFENLHSNKDTVV